MSDLINQYIQVGQGGVYSFYLPTEIVGVRVKGTGDNYFFVTRGSGRLLHDSETNTYEFAFENTQKETFIIPLAEIAAVTGYPVEGGEDGLI